MHLVNNEAPESDQGALAPIAHYINYTTRRVLMCRGEAAEQDARDRGFKKASAAHFVKYVDNAQKGFRKKPKQKGSKRK
ncbi:hypothetical protein [uncultured Sphingomonas sp.]|uniref:hypothetical protein n=1 Tax=uncultured Sphingomonas sp. TaxID=158754 RepID=UPI002599EA2A|nr:hypothetical protein [uncultured Sphingomonas sp.]